MLHEPLRMLCFVTTFNTFTKIEKKYCWLSVCTANCDSTQLISLPDNKTIASQLFIHKKKFVLNVFLKQQFGMLLFCSAC